jgi:hypothetical protein
MQMEQNKAKMGALGVNYWRTSGGEKILSWAK